jgi:proteasome lid subunit RPN8/RPN11
MLTVEDDVLTATLAYLRSCLPHEGVALWSGKRGHVSAWTPLSNIASHPTTRYQVDPAEWIAALHACASRGLSPLALVHSHPTSSAVPSDRDRAEWYYPELLCVIFSFAEGQSDWQVHRLS